LIDAGLAIPGINDGYAGAGPDVGAYEYLPSLTLHARPGDSTVYLDWQVEATLPSTTTWRIAYTPPVGSPSSPVTGIPEPTRAYTLTGVTNYQWHTVTLNAVLEGVPTYTDTTTVMPTDLFAYLPVVFKNAAQ
jgi:hypothetical protein